MDNNFIFAAWLGIVIMVAFLVPYILYLVTLQNTLKTISPVNRQMEPGRVWLLLIPVFNLIWNFIVAAKLADSLEAEYSSRGGDAGPRPTYNLGLAVSILWCCGALFGFLGLAALVCWIIYWVKINGHRKQLQTMQPKGDSQIF